MLIVQVSTVGGGEELAAGDHHSYQESKAARVCRGALLCHCCRANTDRRQCSRRLIAILADSQKAIAASQPVIHYYSHIVYAFLRTKLTVVGCTLHDLVSAVAKENDSSLPNDQSVLTEILTTLSDKGQDPLYDTIPTPAGL